MTVVGMYAVCAADAFLRVKNGPGFPSLYFTCWKKTSMKPLKPSQDADAEKQQQVCIFPSFLPFL